MMESTTATPAELARRLVALEASRAAIHAEIDSDVARVCEKLRIPLAKLAGQAGYHSLIARALALAKSKDPALASVQVNSDGSLTGLTECENRDPGAAIVVVVNLLALLITFVGEPITLGLIRDGWPDANLENTPSKPEEKS
jgi:hypothetical protein